jgi:hypothetical protein
METTQGNSPPTVTEHETVFVIKEGHMCQQFIQKNSRGEERENTDLFYSPWTPC